MRLILSKPSYQHAELFFEEFFDNWQLTWCDCSDGKAEDSALRSPGFNPQPKARKSNNLFTFFWLVALEPMRSASEYFPYCCKCT